jgi:hypothetical protein
MGPVGFFIFFGKKKQKQQNQGGEDEENEGDHVKEIQVLPCGGVEVDIFDGEVSRGDGREVEEDDDI